LGNDVVGGSNMELTIKISLSPEEAKGQFNAVEIGGPVPSLQPWIALEGAPSDEIIGLSATVPSPEASLIEPSMTMEAPRPSDAMIAGIPPEEQPPDILLVVGELPPNPTMILEIGQEAPVPELIPEHPSEKRH
jgi:hypothetical protein